MGRAHRRQHCLQRSGYVEERIVVPYPQYAIALAFEPLRSPLVGCGLFLVVTAIEFDDQSCLQAYEIRDAWSDGNLPAELVPTEAFVPYLPPECTLCVSRGAPEFAGPGVHLHGRKSITLILAKVRATGGLTLILAFSPQGRRDLQGRRELHPHPRLLPSREKGPEGYRELHPHPSLLPSREKGPARPQGASPSSSPSPIKGEGTCKAAGGLTLILAFSHQGRRDLPRPQGGPHPHPHLLPSREKGPARPQGGFTLILTFSPQGRRDLKAAGGPHPHPSLLPSREKGPEPHPLPRDERQPHL